MMIMHIISVRIALLVLAIGAVSAASVNVPVGASQEFTAQVVDQFGHPMADQSAYSFAWTADGGTLSPDSGNPVTYTAGTTVGNYEISCNAAGFSATRVIVIAEQLPGIDFSAESFESYGGNQDEAGSVTLEDGGATVFLAGNAWKAVPFTYTVSADTVIRFEFRSGLEGEIQGIGLDEDLSYNNDLRVFQLYGTDANSSFIQDYNDYAPDAWKTYEIPIGQYYTGEMTHMVFVNDDDGSKDGEARYRSVQVYEAGQPVITRTIIIDDIGTWRWDCSPAGTVTNPTGTTKIEGLDPTVEHVLSPYGGNG